MLKSSTPQKDAHCANGETIPLGLDDCALILFALEQLITPSNAMDDSKMTISPDAQQGLSRLFHLLGNAVMDAHDDKITLA